MAKIKGKEIQKLDQSADNAFVVIETGGKQYKVSGGDVIKIEKITGTFKIGDEISFDKILLKVDEKGSLDIGTPYVDGSKVLASLVEEGRNQKIEVIKYKAKSNYFKRRGHRQPYFKVRVDSIK